MAKLNRNEIDAVANKTYNTLKKVAEQKRKDIMANYKPSDFYNRVMNLAIKRTALEKELDEVRDALYEIGRESSYYWYGLNSKSMHEIEDMIINMECKLPEIPIIEELRDDVTIAAIDKNFDTDKFIENFVKNFNL